MATIDSFKNLDLQGNQLNIFYVPLPVCIEHLFEKNPKKHDLGALAKSFEKYGFIDSPVWEPNLNEGKGGIAGGNGRIKSLEWMRYQKRKPPQNICLLQNPVRIGSLEIGAGEWCVPVQFGADTKSEAAATALAIDLNNLTLSGGDYTPLEVSRLWEDTSYLKLLKDIADANEDLPITVDGDDLDLLCEHLLSENEENHEKDGRKDDSINPNRHREPNLYILAIYVDKENNKRWESFKESIGEKKDNLAFLKMLDMWDKKHS